MCLLYTYLKYKSYSELYLKGRRVKITFFSGRGWGTGRSFAELAIFYKGSAVPKLLINGVII